MEFQYEELVRRNSPLLTREAQERLRQTKLLIAGCGQGSVLAEAAVRMGFEHLVLVDGDVVELANLNRQAYELGDLGSKKAQSLGQKLRRINPDCKLTTVEDFLNTENVASLVSMADIVVDFIDLLAFEDIVTLHREARAQGRTIVAPFGAGWGAALIVFTPETISLEEIFEAYTGVKIGQFAQEDLPELLLRFQDNIRAMPDYVRQTLLALLKPGGVTDMATACATPAIAALAATQLTIAAIVGLALGQPVKTAPEVIHTDPWMACIASPSGEKASQEVCGLAAANIR